MELAAGAPIVGINEVSSQRGFDPVEVLGGTDAPEAEHGVREIATIAMWRTEMNNRNPSACELRIRVPLCFRDAREEER